MNTDPQLPPSDPTQPAPSGLRGEPAPEPRPAAGGEPDHTQPPGFIDGLRNDVDEIKQAAGRYASARARLLGIEAKEAASEVGGAAARLAGAAFFGVIFYLLIIAGLIGMAERYRPESWPVATLIIAAAHLMLAVLLFTSGKRRLHNPERFSESLKQFEQDREWLDQTTKKN